MPLTSIYIYLVKFEHPNQGFTQVCFKEESLARRIAEVYNGDENDFEEIELVSNDGNGKQLSIILNLK